MNRYKRKCKPLDILSDETAGQILEKTLQILQGTGVVFQDKPTLDLFEKAGCKVHHDKQRVMLPADLVWECLRKCPRSFTIQARNADNNLEVDDSALYFYNSMGNRTVDLHSWEMRRPSLIEQHEAVRVLDALDNLHMIGCYTPYMEVEGVSPLMMLPESFASRLRNSSKIVQTAYSHDSEIFAIQMAQAIDTEVPAWLMAGPPLTFYADACKAATRFAEAEFPFFIVSGTGYGATGPVTIAGSSITYLADVIAGIVLVQLIRPGSRVIASDFSFPMDMRAGTPMFGNIASVLHSAAFCQICRKIGVPTCICSSGYSYSKKIDIQIGYEKALAAMAAALSGANVVSLHGGIYAELSYHPVQSIVDDDIGGMIGRFVEGFDTSHEMLAFDLIKEIGPAPGHYLDQMHTLKWWRKERYDPKAADQLTYDEWLETGKKSTIDLASDRAKEIIANHRPTPLTEGQEASIAMILADAAGYYNSKI